MRVLEEPGIAQIFNAPIDLILSDGNILQPDLLVLSRDREHLISERGIEGPPNIVVEILSFSTEKFVRVVGRRLPPPTGELPSAAARAAMTRMAQCEQLVFRAYPRAPSRTISCTFPRTGAARA